MERKIGAIILAAGKGKRMQLATQNKVTLLLGEKPIISHIVSFLKKLHLSSIIVVVGHAKESVIKALQDQDVLFTEQNEQLGTADALRVALDVLPDAVTDVLVVYGDDGLLYSDRQKHIVQKLLDEHRTENCAGSFLTIEQENSQDLGRVLRDGHGNLLAIVEEKDATDAQKKITEINPGCFVFHVDFLKTYLPKLEKNTITGEYYLTSLIEIGIKNNEKILAVKGGTLQWRGVNTQEELEKANQLFTA